MSVTDENNPQKIGIMKKILVGLILLIGAFVLPAIARAQDEARKGLIYASPDKENYQERMPGVMMAVVWGDPDKGAHGTFTKFRPGYDAGTHTHTNDVWLLVIKGAYLYRDEAGEKRVGPGEFIRIPGGHKHWSGGDPTEGALFYQEGSAKFDLIPAK
jgi:quercetin dioxygenase-like cupin family protein